ncbi:MAG: TetR/AcrR family transcriptional regulator C-terminal domain-containing protein [Candidatus Dormibacteraceae bacterium]
MIRSEFKRAPLNRQRVLRTALDQADAQGLATLSLHRVAAELGVKAMSLYNHVDGKDALLDGLVEVMWTEVPLPEAGTGWQDALRQLAGDVRRLVHGHPYAAPLLTSRSVIPLRELEVMDAYLSLLQGAGMTEGRAAEILRTLYAYALGFALIEISWLAGESPDRIEDDEVHWMRRITQMVPDDAPDRLLRVALLMCAGCDMDAQFDLGTELMLRGLEELAPDQKAKTSRSGARSVDG